MAQRPSSPNDKARFADGAVGAWWRTEETWRSANLALSYPITRSTPLIFKSC